MLRPISIWSGDCWKTVRLAINKAVAFWRQQSNNKYMATTRSTRSTKTRAAARTTRKPATRPAAKPAEAPRGWNWGAFWLTWIWGIGNQVWIALLALIPVVNIVMAFVLGAKGNEWAWKAKQWNSVEDFRRTQRVWSIIGWILGALAVLFTIIMVAISLFVLKATDAPTDVAREYVSDLQNNRIAEAYEDSSALFKTITTQEKLGEVAKTQQNISTGEFKVTSRRIVNNTATIEGTLKGKGRGDATVTVSLVKAGDQWVVQSYRIR